MFQDFQAQPCVTGIRNGNFYVYPMTDDAVDCHLDSQLLRQYVEQHLREHLGDEFTDGMIVKIGRALEYSALRLPAQMRREIAPKYALLSPETQARISIEQYADHLDSQCDKPKRDTDEPFPEIYSTGTRSAKKPRSQ